MSLRDRPALQYIYTIEEENTVRKYYSIGTSRSQIYTNLLKQNKKEYNTYAHILRYG